MKNLGWLIAFLAVVAMLVMWTTCNKPSEADNYKIDSLTGEVLKAEHALKLKEDSAKEEIAKRDTLIKQAKQEKENTAKQLHTALVRVAVLRGQIGKAKVDKDTIEIVSSCDSLAEFVGELTWIIYDYEKFTDSIIKMYDSQLAAKDSMLEGRREIYATLRRSYDVVTEDYGRLQVDYNKELKRGKKSRLLNKILGGAVIVLTGVVITK
jgi:hypothetical protein